VPYLGEFRSNQIGVFTGSIIILAIALAFVRWIGASRTSDMLAIGGLLPFGMLLMLLAPLIAGKLRGTAPAR
jgi:hypothetical protein